MRLEKAQYTVKAHIICIFGPLSRLLVLVFTTAASLTLPAAVLAQQPARMDAQATKAVKAGATEDASIRPFRVNVPQEAVTDTSQGVQLATIKELARYWATDYDWHKVEARLNALPQFMTNIDGVD